MVNINMFIKASKGIMVETCNKKYRKYLLVFII